MNNALYKLILEESEKNKLIYLPSVFVDCVVFGFDGEKLNVLLTKLIGQPEWMLPGGYVLKDEDIKASATGIFEERTGAQNIFLTQSKTYALHIDLNLGFTISPMMFGTISATSQ